MIKDILLGHKTFKNVLPDIFPKYVSFLNSAQEHKHFFTTFFLITL